MKMNRIHILFFLLFSSVFISSAQTTELAYGVNAGATLSRVGFSPSIPQKLIIQPQGGIVVRYISEKNFGLQAELNYSMRGWKEWWEPTDGASETEFNQYSRSVSYLELPLLTHIYFDLGKRVRIIFNLGPQLGYYLNEKTLDGYFPSQEVPTELQGYYSQKIQNRFDYGIAGGGGFELRTGIGSFILEGRYYYGLSDIFYNKKSDFFLASHNQVTGIKLTYLFRK